MNRRGERRDRLSAVGTPRWTTGSLPRAAERRDLHCTATSLHGTCAVKTELGAGEDVHGFLLACALVTRDALMIEYLITPNISHYTGSKATRPTARGIRTRRTSACATF